MSKAKGQRLKAETEHVKSRRLKSATLKTCEVALIRLSLLARWVEIVEARAHNDRLKSWFATNQIGRMNCQLDALSRHAKAVIYGVDQKGLRV